MTSAFIKACLVIESCNSVSQMEMAFSYLKLAGTQYNDQNQTFRILANMWSDKLEALRNEK